MDVFLLFLAVGLLAQVVDGALGMAYGVIANTVLLAFGVPPAAASASVHVAKIFTGGASAVSHVMHRNILWSLFWPLAAGGMIGGVVGAYVLTGCGCFRCAGAAPWASSAACWTRSAAAAGARR